MTRMKPLFFLNYFSKTPWPSITRIRLAMISLPWGILALGWCLKLSPSTWEYSGVPWLEDRAIPWSVWYCTDDPVGNEGKLYIPGRSDFLLYGGAREADRPPAREALTDGKRYPSTYCSGASTTDIPLPDSLHLVWGWGGKTQQAWIAVKSRLPPVSEVDRRYTFALRARKNGQVDFITNADSLKAIEDSRTPGFVRSRAENKKDNHVTVW